MIQDIIFDLDGTLIDSWPGIERAITASWHAVFPGRALPGLRPLLGPPIGQIFLTIDPHLSSRDRKKLISIYRKLYDEEYCLDSRLFPGCASVLRELLAKSRRLYITTNKPSKPTAKVIGHLRLRPFFKAVLSLDSRTPPFKNKGEMIRALMAQHRLASNAMVMVGDAMEDGTSADECGVRFICARYGYGHVSTGSFARGLFDLEAISDLPRRLAGL